MKRSQTSLEFIILYSVLSVMVIIAIVLGYGEVISKTKEKESADVKDLALKIQNEILIASNSEDGYKRIFNIPDKIENIEYTATINGTSLNVNTSSVHYFLFVPNTLGNLKKGSNEIQKKEEIIYLNT